MKIVKIEAKILEKVKEDHKVNGGANGSDINDLDKIINLHIKHLSNDDCYRIHELFDSRYAEKIEKLKQKIIKQNN